MKSTALTALETKEIKFSKLPSFLCLICHLMNLWKFYSWLIQNYFRKTQRRINKRRETHSGPEEEIRLQFSWRQIKIKGMHKFNVKLAEGNLYGDGLFSTMTAAAG